MVEQKAFLKTELIGMDKWDQLIGAVNELIAVMREWAQAQGVTIMAPKFVVPADE
ncbi:MAG: hypothetical protein H7836_16070 [Magnetococcus sp. YQC-3]